MTRAGRPKITIVRGAERTLERYARSMEDAGAIVVAPATAGVPYDGARQWVRRASTFAEIEEPRPSPSRLAFLPRAVPGDPALALAWSDALTRAFDGTPAPIVLRARRTDLATIALLRPTLRQMEAPPPLVILDALLPRAENVLSRTIAERVSAEIAQIHALQWTRREVLTEVDGGESAPPLRALATPRGIEDVRAAFAAFAMDGTLLLGHALLSEDSELVPRDRAEIHAMCAIAAAGLGGTSLEAVAIEHIAHARASELEPEVRACLALALCGTSPSLTAARRAIEGTRRLPPQPGRYIEAWARRARALSLMAEDRARDAVDDLEEALRLLATGPMDLSEPEITRTQHTIARDLAKALSARGDHEGVRAWRAQAEACAGRLPPGWSVPHDPLDLAAERTRLDDAIGEREAAAARARAAWEPSLEAEYTRELAALYTCRGEALRAYTCTRLGKRLREALGGGARELLDAEIACATAAYRAGMFEAAASCLESVLASPLTGADERRADIYASLPRV